MFQNGASMRMTLFWHVALCSQVETDRLGGVVVSVLATGPKGRRFKPGQGDGFLRVIKSAVHLPLDGK
jgi:hypothetical protein